MPFTPTAQEPQASVGEVLMFDYPNSNKRMHCVFTADRLWQATWINRETGRSSTMDKRWDWPQLWAIINHFINVAVKEGLY
jgi:hypothetical protein